MLTLPKGAEALYGGLGVCESLSIHQEGSHQKGVPLPTHINPQALHEN